MAAPGRKTGGDGPCNCFRVHGGRPNDMGQQTSPGERERSGVVGVTAQRNSTPQRNTVDKTAGRLIWDKGRLKLES